MPRKAVVPIALICSVALPALAARPDNTVDQPNPIELRRWTARHKLVQRARLLVPRKARAAMPEAKSGTDRVLVILVEFSGSETFEFIPTGANKSTWDPIGKSDSSEWTGTEGDCSLIVKKYNITGPRQFTYSGPLHNKTLRPPSAADRASTRVWTEDFGPQYYQDLLFGDGVRYQYTRQDGSQANDDLSGTSLRNYLLALSGGMYDIAGDVVGWVSVPHSIWWYGADPCPGRNSAPGAISYSGGIPKAGTAGSLVIDALEAVKRADPGFDWARYDSDGDGVIDHLVIVHAGTGESAPYVLLDRTEYGEGSLWPHASAVSPAYSVASGVRAGPYIMVPEDGAAGVFAHEYAHNIGAEDLYDTDASGIPSVSFWSLMGWEHVGQPEGALPSAMDAWHLDFWGWLNPLVISDLSQEYRVTLGQTANTPAGPDVYRGVQIQLPDQKEPLPVQPRGSYGWWGGQEDLANARMALVTPIAIPDAGSPTLRVSIAYNIEDQWDFLWVQASADGGETWRTLTNEHTVCRHDAEWIGGENGFPNDLCAAGIGGFTGKSAGFPAYTTETFPLTAFAGKQILLRFWYMTDWGTVLDGPFLDDIRVEAGGAVLFSDGAEAEDANWAYAGTWQRTDGSHRFPHSFYLQWRNVGPDGGIDRGLGTPGWRYGPANTGLLVWYSNSRYTNNRVWRNLFDPPSFGPKGRLLLVDAHPEPYRDPALVAAGFPNEAANLHDRLQARDAPFSLGDTVPITVTIGDQAVTFPSRPGVAQFSDSQGYYPGLEFAKTGPKDTPATQWITADWNGSVVLPSTAGYPVKAPDYRAGQTFFYYCWAYTDIGTIGCNSLRRDISLPSNGGLGGPGEAGGQYGWNVEIVSETPQQATLRIWNDKK